MNKHQLTNAGKKGSEQQNKCKRNGNRYKIVKSFMVGI